MGKKVCIPKLSLTPSDVRITFKFQWRPFSITICFAMTINKSQWQSLKKVGIYFPSPVFSHGQLYVAISKGASSDGLKMLISDENDRDTNMTSIVVYREVFGNVR
jgi:ATP-dependent DNA helicase PIF1